MRKIESRLQQVDESASEKNCDFVSGFRLNNAIAITTRMIARNAFWSEMADFAVRVTDSHGYFFTAFCFAIRARSPGSGSRLGS